MAGTYLLPVQAIQASRRAIAETRIHPHFVGYLCLRQTARREKRQTALRPNFRAFFDDFLSVVPVNQYPYVMPFNERGVDGPQQYFNNNVAGSYAPSSLREDKPLRKVVNVTGQKSTATYSLRENHAELALEHLLFGQRISAVDVAIFIYRNWVLELDQPTASDLLQIFGSDFDFLPGADDDHGFNILFRDADADVRGRAIAFESTTTSQEAQG